MWMTRGSLEGCIGPIGFDQKVDDVAMTDATKRALLRVTDQDTPRCWTGQDWASCADEVGRIASMWLRMVGIDVCLS